MRRRAATSRPVTGDVIATIVDTKALWETVVAAFVAGVGTTIVFSLAILGATRFTDASREGQVAARGLVRCARDHRGAGDVRRGGHRRDRDDDEVGGLGFVSCVRFGTSRSSRCWR